MKSESEVAQSCPTLIDPMDCSLPGSSVYGIFQARVLEWGAIAFSVHQGSKVEIMSLEKYLKKLVFYPKGEQTQRRGHTVIVSKFHAT